MSLAEQSLNRPSSAANVDQVETSHHSNPIDADAPLDLSRLNFSESLATPASERPARIRLTYAELTSVDSTADLLQVYKDKGVTFPSETRFLRHVERDWLAACKEMGPRYGSEALSAPVPLLKVEVAGQSYGILGVVHSFLLGSRSVDAISKTVQDGTNWMHEQNLGSVFSIPDSIELKDHRAVTEMVKSRSAFEQISAAAQMQLGVLAHLLPGPNSPFEMIAENSRVDAQKDDQLALGDVGLFPSLKKMSAIPEQIVASGGFPPYVAIEYKLRHGLELNHCQLRSAYMAELLRHWEVPGQKNILVGRAHAAEVAYFLKHPLANPTIQNLAQEHAKIVNAAPDKTAPLAAVPTWNAPLTLGNVMGTAALWIIAFETTRWVLSSGILSQGLHWLGF